MGHSKTDFNSRYATKYLKKYTSVLQFTKEGVEQTLENTFNMSDINHGRYCVFSSNGVEFPSFWFDKGGLFILNVIVAS